MPIHPMVAETWPHLGALQDTLERLTSREHVVKTKEDKHRPEDSDDEFADRVHRVLLRKKRSGPLGLGD